MQLFGGLEGRIEKLEAENAHLFNVTNILAKRLAELEKSLDGQAPAPTTKAAAPAAKKVEESDEDDFKFSDDEEDEKPVAKETEMQKMKRLAAEKKAQVEADKKAKDKKKPVLKSNVILDVKPWDDETDMKELETAVRGIQMEGLVWGSSKLVEIGFGIKKLQISTCIVDDLVGLYDLEDNVSALEDYVQSVDIASHNKI